MKDGGGSVMGGGYMSAKGPGNLHIIDSTTNQKVHLDILKQSTEKFGIERAFKFYQDNEPKHKAHKVKVLFYNCPKVIETPPQSPDLYFIENL